jgi:hypothetical protein
MVRIICLTLNCLLPLADHPPGLFKTVPPHIVWDGTHHLPDPELQKLIVLIR